MRLKEFPDINWLKKQISHGFSDRTDWNGKRLLHPGWPTVFLNAQTRQAYRPDVKGPLSIFANISGQSQVTVDGHTTLVGEDFFYISNQEQSYSFNIDSRQKVETFNIHLSDHFVNQIFQSLTQQSEQLLDDPYYNNLGNINFSNRLYHRDEKFNSILKTIYKRDEGLLDPIWEEEKLFELVTHLLSIRGDEIRKLQNIPALKSSTKEEIARRLYRAVDYMHSYYNKSITLEELGQIALISKFHFLRLFKLVFQQSPHQYLTQLRIQKTIDLLVHTDCPLSQIALQVGLETASSLSRLFNQKVGCYPSVYRQAVKN